MARLTREKSQLRNRERLLAAARALFLRDGYNATTLAGIAEHAGFSTGAVYSNFAGKPELATLVLEAIQAEQAAALRSAVTVGGPPETLIGAIMTWAERALGSGWPRLELEFALAARSDARLVSTEAARQRASVDDVAALLSLHLPPALAAQLPMRAIADAIVNLAIGLAVRHQIDPRTSLAPFEELLREAFRLGEA